MIHGKILGKFLGKFLGKIFGKMLGPCLGFNIRNFARPATAANAAAALVFQKRVENERPRWAFGRSCRRRVGSVGRIEHARLAGLALRVDVGLRGGVRLLCRVRRQVERAFSAAAAEREHGYSQQDHGPSRRRWTADKIHDQIPNAAAPYKDCFVLARPAAT
jgi:hypothetical protein